MSTEIRVTENNDGLSTQLRTAGIILVILGILSLVAPLITGVAVSLLVGLALLVAGLSKGIRILKGGAWREHRHDLILGGIAAFGGLVIVIWPLLGLAAITLVLAAYFLTSGLVQIFWGWHLRPRPGAGWMLFAGGATLLLAFLIGLEWPLSGRWAIGTLVGIHLLLSGWSLIGLASSTSR